MNAHRLPRTATAVVVGLVVVVGACSTGDDSAAGPVLDPDTTTSETEVEGEGADASPASSAVGEASATTEAAASSGSVDVSVVTVPETGIPGLDSDDAFCAAWSAFAGSWQVIAVSSAFLGDPAATAEFEILAAPTVAKAFGGLEASFPDELDDERELVLDGYFGPFARRSADALEALRDSGAHDGDLAMIATVWADALARRDPTTPELSIELSEHTAVLVADAAEMFADRRVAFVDDPTMVIVVETPGTDAFLETACPDQGTLTGQEVGG